MQENMVEYTVVSTPSENSSKSKRAGPNNCLDQKQAEFMEYKFQRIHQ